MQRSPLLLILGFVFLVSTGARAADGEHRSEKRKQLAAETGEKTENHEKKEKRPNKNHHTPKAVAKNEDGDAPRKLRSAENRQGKTAYAAAEIGLVDVLHFGVGAQAGYFISPNTILEGDVMQSSSSIFGDKSEIDLETVRIKHFLSNSFYLQAGGGLRQVEAKNGDFLFDSDQRSSFKANHIISEIGLGNRWQFTNFLIGCDWVSYVLPIAQLSRSESFGNDVSDDLKASDRNDFDSETRGNVVLVRFHLGWAF